MDSINKKFHITMIAAAAVGVLLLYTTMAFALIGAATGISFGLSIRLFFAHQKTEFAGTKKLDWIVLIIASSLSLLLMLTEDFNIQALFMIFLAVRSLFMYFTMYSKEATVVTENRPS